MHIIMQTLIPGVRSRVSVQTKKMDLYRTPPLLVVQLKRFQFNQFSRRKLNNLVTFPVQVRAALDFVCLSMFTKPFALSRVEGVCACFSQPVNIFVVPLRHCFTHSLTCVDYVNHSLAHSHAHTH
jgi:hypothetical protein